MAVRRFFPCILFCKLNTFIGCSMQNVSLQTIYTPTPKRESAVCISIYLCKCINRFIHTYIYICNNNDQKRSYQLEMGEIKGILESVLGRGRREDTEEEKQYNSISVKD